MSRFLAIPLILGNAYFVVSDIWIDDITWLTFVSYFLVIYLTASTAWVR